MLAGGSGCGDSLRLQEYEVGLQGEARHNPFLAAEFLARELGYEAQSERRLQSMPPTDWALLVHQQALGSRSQLESLLGWTAAGGRLWIEGVPELAWDPTGPAEKGAESRRQIEVGPRLRMLLDLLQEDLSTWEDEEPLPALQLASLPDLSFEWPGPYSVGTGELGGLQVAGTSDSAAILRMEYDRGQVELFAGLHGFDTHHLRDADRAQVFAHLLAHPKPVAGLQILYGRRMGFFGMLWERAWPLLVLFGAWILFWLWGGLRRFGPVQQDPHWDPDGQGVGRRREFTEHLEAAAHHYQQAHAQSMLTQSAQDLRAARGAEDATEGQPTSQAHSFQVRMRLIQRRVAAALISTKSLTPSSVSTIEPETDPKDSNPRPNHAKR